MQNLPKGSAGGEATFHGKKLPTLEKMYCLLSNSI